MSNFTTRFFSKCYNKGIDPNKKIALSYISSLKNKNQLL